ncbi:hypothetical protein VTO42DRAFT_2718 [Malbranchea cinnamomea]
MATCCYWNWSKFALGVFKNRAVSALKYLPPGSHCTVEYPVKLRPNGRRSRTYWRVVTADNPGPFYIFHCILWDCFSRTELLSADFIVPSRDPGSDLDRFRAEWVAEESVFVVSFADLPFAEPYNKKTSQPLWQTRNVESSCADDLFEIEYLHRDPDPRWEDQSQYDLGLFAVRDGVPIFNDSIRNALRMGLASPDEQKLCEQAEFDEEAGLSFDLPPKPHFTADGLEDLLKPEKFNWCHELDEGTPSPRSSQELLLHRASPVPSRHPPSVKAVENLSGPELFSRRTEENAEHHSKTEATSCARGVIYNDTPSSPCSSKPPHSPQPQLSLETVETLLTPDRFDWSNEFDEATPIDIPALEREPSSRPQSSSVSQLSSAVEEEIDKPESNWYSSNEFFRAETSPLSQSAPQLYSFHSPDTVENAAGSSDQDDEIKTSLLQVSSLFESFHEPQYFSACEPPTEVSPDGRTDMTLGDPGMDQSAPDFAGSGDAEDTESPETSKYTRVTGSSHYERLRDNTLHSVAAREMEWQGQLIQQYPDIHHFNWLGDAVMERSDTAPEVSLFVILTGAKPCLSELSREGVLLRQAMRYVDPVIYHGDWGPLEYSGASLLSAIAGKVFPFYTAVGTWQDDPYSHADYERYYDPTNPSEYLTQRGIPFNGWFGSRITLTRLQFWDHSAHLLSVLQKKRRGPQTFQRSPLSQCTFADSGAVSCWAAGKVRCVRGKAQFLAFPGEIAQYDTSSSFDDISSTGCTSPASDSPNNAPDEGQRDHNSTTEPSSMLFLRRSSEPFREGQQPVLRRTTSCLLGHGGFTDDEEL